MNEERPPSDSNATRCTSWLSKGLEALLAEQAQPAFDVVIVGSGYGAAVAAAELAGWHEHGASQPLRVCVLERGREYLEGAFPDRMAELAGHVRYSKPTQRRPRGARTGLFDLRLGPDVCSLVANGVGGGSLINAGVMVEPDVGEWQRPAWPAAIRGDDMAPWLDRAAWLLGAQRGPDPAHVQPNAWSDPKLPKFAALKGVARKARPAEFSAPAITVALRDEHTQAGGVERTACNRCGNCATGCNWGAKESLDTNLLARAWRRGAAIYSGATVEQVSRSADRAYPWNVHVNHTDPLLRRRQGRVAVAVRARRVILAAGTYGSTEILLRSELPLSPRLGTGFSANGDMIAAVVGLDRDANAVADDAIAPSRRGIGPTITAMIDDRAAADPVVVQELAVPSGLRRLLQETTALSSLFAQLADADKTRHTARDRDPLAVDPDLDTARTLLIAVIGRDGADGTMRLAETTRARSGDGTITVDWRHARDDPRLADRLQRVATWVADAKTGGRVLANPLWRLLPESAAFLLDDARGPLLTVHPLGGCPMGGDAFNGVVDDCGRVFVGPPKPDQRAAQAGKDPEPGEVYEGLVVLDGSILPTSLGINPALTIAALALRAVSALRKGWRLRPAESWPDEPPPHQRRPHWRAGNPDAAPPLRRTEVQLIERLHAPVTIRGKACHAELTLEFDAVAVDDLVDPDPARRRLDVDPQRSRLRVYSAAVWDERQRFPHEERPDDAALWIAPVVAGSVCLLAREASTACQRRRRALWPWFRNRGTRDIWHAVQDSLLDFVLNRAPREPQPEPLPQLVRKRVAQAWRLLSRAGEVRLFDYELTLGAATAGKGGASPWREGAKFAAAKRLTYARRSNPWRQLLRVHVTEAPFACRDAFDLDLQFLVRGALPILRIVAQQDQPTALVDLARLGLYLMRVVVQMHAWSFRRPDEPEPRTLQRLPRDLRLGGTNVRAAVQEVAVDHVRTRLSAAAVTLRLTRYENASASRRPVVLLHGYSLSGTMFAHHSTRGGLAGWLWQRGRDVWVVDLRSSQGMPTAREPWKFEDMAYADIPLAIDHVCRATGHEKVDVVAHCMGSAMLWMGLLGAPANGAELPHEIKDRYARLRQRMRQRIGALVMSQVPPVILFSPGNLVRAFVMRYVRQYLDAEGFAFRVEGRRPSLGDQLLDRLLATLPYPEDEFDIENPWFARTPWVGTRHRLDALYGRAFALANLSPDTLKYIDDHFGPLSLETVSQVIHFARRRQLTDSHGQAVFVNEDNMKAALQFPVLGIHGQLNGLADVATKHLMERYLDRLSMPDRCEFEVVEGYGHQDCLIGRHAARDVYPLILQFLDRAAS